MKNKILFFLVVAAGALLFLTTEGYSYPSLCPYPGTGCTGCHPAPGGGSWPACPPPPPSCTDNDNDGYGDPGDASCANGSATDCNDNNAAINPGAVENCTDNIDNNCNDLVDDLDPAAVGCPVCNDSDSDGYGDPGDASCANGPARDCNDSSPNINPGATDIPNNGIDEDCSGADAVDPTLLDNDGDGYSLATGDCDDSDPAIHPNAFDIPNNGIDENCDGVDAIDNSNLDNDADGFTPADGDCDDSDPAVNPDAIELCADNIDNNCDGLVDSQDVNAVDCPLNCIDTDYDTYAIDGGDCGQVDCNDNDAAISPGVEEVCDDGEDDDCDGSVDEGCDVTCPDADIDGFQDAACGGSDCNDADALINPAAEEVCGNNIDENCNGASDDVCLNCPDGSILVIREMEYERGDGGKLEIEGRATAGATITVMNGDTGAILADNVRAREGKWEAELRRVGRNLSSITVVSSFGCSVDQEVNSGDDDDDDHSYRVGDDDRDSGSRRSKRSRRSGDDD